MSDWTDRGDGDDDPEPFAEYRTLGDKYEQAYPEPDPDAIGPDAPEPPDFSDRDVDPTVEGRFWILVLVFNAGLFAVSLGVMFAAFEGAFSLGGRLAAAGGLILAYGLYQYRETKRLVSERVDSTDEDGNDADADSDTDTEENETQPPLPQGRMRTVRDSDGDTYLLLKESGESSLVEDPETGERAHLPNETLEVVDGESPLEMAATAVSDDLRRVLTAAHDERALGLLLELDARGPVDVRMLTSSYDLCESDLHGLLAEFRAAGLIEEVEVAGQRGYGTTEAASDALATVREADD